VNTWRCTLVLGLALGLSAAGCFQTPPSIRTYASDLPARADGQYALLDDAVKKQLVLKDAALQCSIDVDDGKTDGSSACTCAESANDDWTIDCKAWLGAHTPPPVVSTGPVALPSSEPANS
jgi:hypothetical protein